MTCQLEIQKLRDQAGEPDEEAVRVHKRNIAFRLGYLTGYQDALKEAAFIVAEHEERNE